MTSGGCGKDSDTYYTGSRLPEAVLQLLDAADDFFALLGSGANFGALVEVEAWAVW